MEHSGSKHVKFEPAKDMESPRFRAIIRATSGRRRRPPTDVKSFSHELNSKGVQQPPIRKLRGPTRPEDVMKVIRSRFNRLKEEVNAELCVFAGDLVNILEKGKDEDQKWRETIEDLLVTSQKCAEMSPDVFWAKCDGIVQNLDDRRQELPLGTLKQAHTRILFILTRCTRLLQLQKDGAYREENHVLGLHQLSDLGFYPTSEEGGLKASLSSKDMQERILRRRIKEHKHHSQQDFGSQQFSETDSPGAKARISSWKKFPSATEKNQKKGHDHDSDSSPTKVLDTSPIIHKTNEEQTEMLAATMHHSEILANSSDLLLKNQAETQDDAGDQQLDVKRPTMICRICEFEIPTVYADGHFKICTIADRCDSKGLSIDDRLERVTEVIEKILASCTHKKSDTKVNPGEVTRIKSSSLLEESDDESLCQKAQNSADIMEIFPVVVGNLIANNLSEVHAISTQSYNGMSPGCMTPQSPLLTPRTSPLDFLTTGNKALTDLENFQQIESLLNIVQSIAKIKTCDYSSLENLNSYLEDLNAVVETRKVDALVVETFGRRIAKLLQEKFIQLCDQIDDGSADWSKIITELKGSLGTGITQNSKASPLGVKMKDRTSIEDFEIIKPISRGAFGRVFLAKKRITGDLFAIKVLKKADTIRKNAVESILAERDILISARNPFVVRFFYSFTCRENLYLVMEYINGGDLYSLLRNLGCLDEDMARQYIAEVVLALEYLHSLSVIHRDLKPDNLLIARDGHIKLTDFGLSKVGLINSTDDLSGPDVSSVVLSNENERLSAAQLAEKREQRKKQSAVGTPDYLAPEILLGMSHGPTADWWSVGVILFELLVGIPPFNAEHPQIIFDNIMNHDIPWPQVPEEMSFEAYDLINKLLIQTPVQRLGATGAGEVKAHPFFKDINWNMLEQQKVTFIPATEGEDDTSYFACRHSWNEDDDQIHAVSHEYDDLSDSCSMSGSSAQTSDEDEDGDEFGSMADFGPSLSVKYSFSNFSFKNLSQLASINYDLIQKCKKDSTEGSQS